LGALSGSALTVTLGLFALPVLVDLALTILGPIERRIGDRWVEQAAARLRSSGARVVAITGSYGKTTTKGYAAHLLAGTKRVVASPASFNNRLGLARAVNEQLLPGTEVFIAEMGTYGPGEIAALCEWIQPEVAAIVAIGPVHLERFRTEERIVTAKSEILDSARVGVIAVDNPLLANLANQRRGDLELITVGSEMERVTIRDASLVVDGAVVGQVPRSVMAIDLCVAVGICLALGVETAAIAPRLEGLPRPEHRLTVEESGSGQARRVFGRGQDGCGDPGNGGAGEQAGFRE
jgi:UDP-N-acetylmuramoyl-tripeptide--D-alanyl-D-alanine ligase